MKFKIGDIVRGRLSGNKYRIVDFLEGEALVKNLLHSNKIPFPVDLRNLIPIKVQSKGHHLTTIFK